MSVTLAEVTTLVGLQLGQSGVGETARFLEELGAESLDILHILLAVEDKYGIHITDREMSGVQSILDLYNLIKRKKGEP